MVGWGVSDRQGWRKGPWTPEEDKLLTQYVKLHGEGRWSSVARSAGLNRNGKSCRLRWVNYLRPGLLRGHLTPQEEGIIIELHALWGNKWSTIARYLPGRTDNEIKNFWRTHFKKKTNPAAKKGKRKLIKLQNQQEENGTGAAKAISPESRSEVICDDQNVSEQQGRNQWNEIQSTYPNMGNPGLPFLYNEVESWWDSSIPADGLWGWLWNLDDQNGGNGEQPSYNWSKMAN